MGPIGNLILSEGGHPVPDANSYRGTQLAIDAVKDLGENDLVLFLISGGGSALFEKPLVPEEEMADITRQLLACGADIVEMNTLRKRLSAVKGGKFAKLCAPAKVFSIILSDVLGDPLDMIASGPAYPDSSTREQALAIIEKYQLRLSDAAMALMEQETPKTLANVESHITGSVKQLCAAAAETAESLGYKPVVLTASLSCEARDAGSFLASIAQYHRASGEKLAFIAGGETVVHLTGKGKGGRNQELALSGARGIAGLENTVLFSLGSDGTDGPTDAAGGMVDGNTAAKLKEKGIAIDAVLQNNDAYHALQAVDGLIVTGPTGTNVNDLSVLLLG
jgi:hydroxypyruvate reductase